jgi:hypothetical protein
MPIRAQSRQLVEAIRLFDRATIHVDESSREANAFTSGEFTTAKRQLRSARLVR